MRALTLLEKIVVGALIVGIMAFVFGASISYADPKGLHLHWSLTFEGADGSDQHLAFNAEKDCKGAAEYVLNNLPEVILMSECIEIPLLEIKRAPAPLQGEKS